MKIRPRRKTPGKMNRWEQSYADRLELIKMSGGIHSYAYESVRLTLAPSTTFTPDFLVVTNDEIQFHEVKGQRFAAGMAKFKIAASLYPWAKWIMVEKTKQGWKTIMEG